MEILFRFDDAAHFMDFGGQFKQTYSAVIAFFRNNCGDRWGQRNLPVSVGFQDDPQRGIVLRFVMEADAGHVEVEFAGSAVTIVDYKFDTAPKRAVIVNGEMQIEA